MCSLRLSLHRSVARFLAMIVLMLGLTDPSQSLAETLADCAPVQCISVTADRHHAPPMTLTDFEIGDGAADLEQLLSPRTSRKSPAVGNGADFPAVAVYLPPPHSPPLLRPPASLS